MNTKMITRGTLAGLVLVGGIAGIVSAQSVAEATGLTEQQVIEIALIEVPGEVVEVELERHRGQEVYEIEVLGEDGTVMEVEIATETGEILSVKAENEECGQDKGDDPKA